MDTKVKDTAPKYIRMYQDLPSDLEGYTINLGETKKEWHIFICNSQGVPVIVESHKPVSDPQVVYKFAKELTNQYFDNNEERNN